jgi:tRNA/tmRNA/rRNA uracil-C5-methylase (TrmA/RlmC/RlmD family)
MLREGKTTQRIAEKFNVSRQAIDLHRRDFISKGLLANQRAARKTKALPQAPSRTTNPTSNWQSQSSKDITSLDGQIDLMINAFDALKRLPQLEIELETYKQQYEKALSVIKSLNENEKTRLGQETRWLLTHNTNTHNI